MEAVLGAQALERLGALDAVVAREMFADRDPQLRIQAMRASETLYKGEKGDKSLAADYRRMLSDPEPDVVIQAMLTMNLQRVPDARALVQATSEASSVRGVQFIGGQLLRPNRTSLGQPASNDAGVGYLNLSAGERSALLRGEATYRELCATCHGEDGQGRPVVGAPGRLLAPALAESARVTGHRDYVLQVLLNGLQGELDGRSYEGGVMVPMAASTDEWIADVANYVRNAFGNSGRPLITSEQVTALRTSATRPTPWTLAELTAVVPAQLTNTADWTVTSSHNVEGAAAFASGTRWDSGTSQEPGMWFQIELPQPARVTELQFDVDAGPNRGTAGLGGFTPVQQPARGGGGRGGARGGGGGGRGRGGPAALGPVGYEVQVSLDGTTWSAPVAQGNGPQSSTVVGFRPVDAKFIRITQTGRAAAGEVWAIQQARVFALPR